MNNYLFAQAPVTDASPYLDKLTSWNEQLNGLPGGTLTALFVIVMAITLRWLKLFPNEWVPRSTLLLGIGVYFTLALPRATGTPIQIWFGKNFCIGFIISAVATMAAIRFGPLLPVIGKYLQDEKPTDPPPTP